MIAVICLADIMILKTYPDTLISNIKILFNSIMYTYTNTHTLIHTDTHTYRQTHTYSYTRICTYIHMSTHSLPQQWPMYNLL